MADNRAVINLDTFMSEYIHRPVPKTGTCRNIPLYKRNDGKNEGGAKDSDWIKASEKYYNSPNNIRRLFITSNEVIVHYYKPIAGGQVNLEKIYSFGNNRWGLNIQDEINLLAGGMNPGQSRISKTGLGALKSWSCSNLEEVYFDLSLFASIDTMQIANLNLIQLISSGRISGALQDSKCGNIIQKLFTEATLSGNQKISDIFPRLKTVCFIQQLKTVYERTGKSRDSVLSALTGSTIWYTQDLVKPMLGVKNNAMIYFNTPQFNKANSKFFTRDYYCFDEEILTPYFEECRVKIERAIRDRQGTLVTSDTDNRTELEKKLDAYYNELGEIGTAILLLVSNEKLDNFTKQGQEKYGQLKSKYYAQVERGIGYK